MQDGHTALTGASSGGHLAVVRYLHEKGADLNTKSNVRASFSHLTSPVASSSLRLIACPPLSSFPLPTPPRAPALPLQDGGFNIGSTALIRAAGAGHLKVVKYLHEKGADRYASVFARFAGGGTYTDALGYARTCGHKEVAAFLQKAAGSELWQAHRDGNLAEVKRLLEYFRS